MILNSVSIINLEALLICRAGHVPTILKSFIPHSCTRAFSWIIRSLFVLFSIVPSQLRSIFCALDQSQAFINGG